MQTNQKHRRGKLFRFLAVPFMAIFILAFQNCGSPFAVMEYAELQQDLSSGNTDPAASPTPTPSPVVTPSPSPVVTPTPSPTPDPVGANDGRFLRGINIMDLGIADHAIPGVYGTNYTKPNFESIRLLRNRGLTVLRIPFKWERVQRTLQGPLDTAYLGYIMQVLKDADTVGIKIILDMHNYCRYKKSGVTTRFGEANGPTHADYADVWKRLVLAIKADPNAYNAVYAYDIMNEPYTLPTVNGLSPQKLWEGYSQAAVTAIRSVGETKLIHVEGYFWSSAERWPSLHPVPWINDPAKNIMYHAHMYMDNDSSGTYTISFAEETAKAKSQGYASVAARGIARAKKFSDWVQKHNTRGFIGEYGWPTSAKVGESEAAAWNQTGDQFLGFLDSVKMGATMWATGSWLGPAGNIMNTYVLPVNGKAFQPLSQAPILEKHPGN